ncbi:hypothetical protein SRHO_G00032810 [Serrasalmus rhombeus]
MYLERADEDYKKNGTLLTTSEVKADTLEKLAESVYSYTAYPSSAQISDVAEALVEKYPCLREPGSFSGYYAWQQSIKYKMANYHTKLGGFGVPEERRKKVKNVKGLSCMIQEKMAKTSAHRRHGIISQTPSREDIKARWPALFKASHLQDEFQRIITVHLESKFMSKLDEYTPKLLVLFHSRGGAVGLRLQAILLKDADGDGASQDLAVQKMKIYKIQTEASEGTADFGIVVESGKVLTDLGNFARACSMLVGFAYAVDLAYPKELRSCNPVSLKAKSVPRWVLQAALNSEMMMDFTQWSPVVPAPVL